MFILGKRWLKEKFVKVDYFFPTITIYEKFSEQWDNEKSEEIKKKKKIVKSKKWDRKSERLVYVPFNEQKENKNDICV